VGGGGYDGAALGCVGGGGGVFGGGGGGVGSLSGCSGGVGGDRLPWARGKRCKIS
jgi:hypothetical protein